MKKYFLTLLFQLMALIATAQQHVIYGHIYDDATGESLISANIYNPSSLKGTTSNEYGYYSLRLPDGDQTVNISYVGYETMSLKLSLSADTMITIRLQPSAQLQEVVVTDNRPEVGVKSTRNGTTSLPLDIVRNMPVLLSEPDVLKTIQALPGVQPGMAGTCGIHVRGGDPDQNLFLLDGMPLYNVNHAFGFVSVFQAEAVKNVDFYKSSFPARFGGRLSSIVDVRTKDGDMKKYYGSFSIGLLTSHLNFEGPIIKDKTSLSVSARRSYLDWLIRPFFEDGEKAGMALYDVTTKLNHRFNDKCRLYLSFYNGRDRMYYGYQEDFDNNGYDDKMEQHWGNTLATMRLNTVIAPRLFCNTTVAYTGYKSIIDSKTYDWYKYYENTKKTEYKTESSYKSGISDASVLSDFDFLIAPKHTAKFGAAVYFHEFRPDVQTLRYKTNDTDEALRDTSIAISPNKITAQEINAYIEDDFPITSTLQANAGVHLSWYNVEGKSYLSAQPRISFSWNPVHDWRIKGGFSLMEQYIHMLTSSDLIMPTDLWVPSTKAIRPMTATHYAIGAYYTGIKGWELTAESYYKKSKNLLEYKDGMSAMGSATNWQDKVEMGEGYSYGLELMAQKKTGSLTGWVNYTLSKTDRIFRNGTINNGIRFPYKYDRRHVANITINYQLSKRVDINAEWNFMSGAKSTVAVGYDVVMEDDYPDVTDPGHTNIILKYEGRNNYSLPATHALNLGISLHKQKKHGESIWTLSAVNAYNHKNADIIYVENEIGDDWDLHTRIKQITIMPILPSFSYTFKF